MNADSRQATRLRNPYRDVFDLYVMRGQFAPIREWEPRTAWRVEDGYKGPAWDRHMDDTINAHMARWHLCERFSFSVPTDEAIAAIAELSPIVEIGAGTGYWASLVEQAGGSIEAFDLEPGGNHWVVDDVQWAEVRQGDHRALSEHRAPTLLLSWPPYEDTMAVDCLRAFRGDTIVYIGEGYGGCCATDAFFEALETSWESVREIHLPQWPGLHDYLSIWRRR